MAGSPVAQATSFGLPPGALIHIGESRLAGVRMRLVRYNAERFEEKGLPLDAELPTLPAPGEEVTWIHVQGIHDAAVVERIGAWLGLHPLIQEDIMNSDQRPKVEDLDAYLFFSLKRLTVVEKSGALAMEQISLILGPGVVVSFQESDEPVFDAIMDRLRAGKGRIRTMGADYLAHALMDLLIDGYFLVMEALEARADDLYNAMEEDTSTAVLREIHNLKREGMTLRRAVWPLRDVIGSLSRIESRIISESLRPYLRDLYDHAIRVLDTAEAFREVVAGMLDLFLSSVSNRMNAVMQQLTIIATTFIPMTFLAGVYGMNFEHMPLLKWPYGFTAFLILTILMGGGMALYFKRKKWF